MQLFSLIHTTPQGEVQLMSCESIAERNQVFNDLVGFYMKQGSVEASQHDSLWILRTKEGRVRILFRDHFTL